MEISEGKIKEVVAKYSSLGNLLSYERINIGHINDTFGVKTEKGEFLLQRLSLAAFKEPLKVMDNIIGVTSYLNSKIKENGGDPSKECLNLVRSDDGNFYFIDQDNGCWRVYLKIPGQTFDSPKSPKQFELAGEAFGRFQYLLSGYPIANLYETIPNFHNTPKRYENLKNAIDNDVKDRKKTCQPLIEEALARKDKISKVVDGLADGSIPLRITHNDTKLNNVIFTEDGTKPLAVLDLDTIMPGSALYDFGDSIRFGANTCKEDEKDLSKIHFDLEMFKSYAVGFLNGTKGSLTEKEISLLPYSGWLLTYECGIRFLEDYLRGDVYFHTAYPRHNLDRALDQFALLKDMETKMEEADCFISSLKLN